jgi:AAA domain
MRLLFLYGPPAVGKLSVARELAARTGFKLFHNHLSVDLVASVFPFGSEPFGRLVQSMRRGMMAEAARQGIDLIFTFVYAAGVDDGVVQELIEPVQTNGGEVLFVQLTCNRDELLARVQAPSRRAFRKLNDPAMLATLLDQHQLDQPVPFGTSLQLDTVRLDPAQAAGCIVAHYDLTSAR